MDKSLRAAFSAVEKFHFGMSLGLAKYYSDAISDNVKRGNEQKLRKGKLPGKAPYGYQNIQIAEKKSNIIVDELAAAIVKKAYELYATGAYSLRAEERRQLIKLVLLNLRIEGKNVVYDVQKPFDNIINASDCQLWCARQDLNLWPTD